MSARDGWRARLGRALEATAGLETTGVPWSSQAAAAPVAPPASRSVSVSHMWPSDGVNTGLLGMRVELPPLGSERAYGTDKTHETDEPDKDGEGYDY